MLIHVSEAGATIVEQKQALSLPGGIHHLEGDGCGAGELAQRLAPAALQEDLGSFPSTCTGAHDCLLHQFQGIWHLNTGIHAGKTPMHKK